jgi:hypothetical protein
MRHAEVARLKSKKSAPQPFDFSGHWKNELGSFMDLTIAGADVTGSYVSAVSDAGGPTRPFPLRGTVSGDLISFTVNWETLIATWIGHGVVDAGQDRILTLWHIVMTVQQETDPLNQWKTLEAGADEFGR